MTQPALFFMRLRGLLRKEVLQILRDPSSIALAIVLPLVLLFIFGYGVSLDAENVPIAIVLDDNGLAARQLAARFDLSPYFSADYLKSMPEAVDRLNQGRVDGIVHVQSDFASRMGRRNQAPVQLIVNGIDANRARLIQGYARGVLQTWTAARQAQGEAVASPAVEISQRVWFNEAAVSRNFLVPGLITLIMTLSGILLTALVVAREWERGTMEAILVTPLRRIDLLLGKVLPYFLLGMLGMVLSVVVAITLFHVPFRGSIGAMMVMSALFMLASLGFGLFISAAVRVQFVAAQISILAGFLPALFLSGLIFDLESTPGFIQIISHVVPARYFVTISHTLFMAGDIWPVLLPNALALLVMAVVFLTLAFRKVTKRLEG
ncbi:MAG: ABC transporter permease [Desulfobacteraceae bacterium]|jgi:ABC-2 type transport system permease protein|nr:ABC transporter permease [Desulfobacteraceae bacterium]